MNVHQVKLEAIITAMISRGFSQQALAEKLDVTQSALSKWINGSNSIPDYIIEKLSTVLDYPKHFFYQNIPVFPRSIIYYRRKVNTNTGELNKIHYKLYVEKFSLKQILGYFNLSVNIPYVNFNEWGSPERIAQYARQFWKIPRGPITNLMQIVENAGILVLLTDSISVDKYKGQILPDEDGLPFIVLNKDLPFDLQRFTLAHELGHLIMHSSGVIEDLSLDPEIAAHMFAAEFLMPKEDILSSLVPCRSLPDFLNLKTRWKVSAQALIRRSKDLKVITEAKYKSLNVQISMQGMRKNEPNFGLQPEIPTLLKSLIDLSISELDHTYESLAEKMCISESELLQIYNRYSPKLNFKIIRGNL